MDLLQMALMVNRSYRDEAQSALPDAPIVPEEAPHPARSRSAAAGLLRRLADVLYPEPAPRRS